MRKISTNPVHNYNYKRVISFAIVTSLVAIVFAMATVTMQLNGLIEISFSQLYYSFYLLFLIGNITMSVFCKYYSHKVKSERMLASIFFIYCIFTILLSAIIASLDVLIYGDLMMFIIVYFLISIYFVVQIRFKMPVTIVSWGLVVWAIQVSERTVFTQGISMLLVTSVVTVGFLSQLFINRMTRKMIEQQEQLKKESERSKILAKELETVNIELRKMALFDPLTDLLNRRALEQYLERKLQVNSPLVCTTYLMDVDFFKQFNDHYGHPAGDDVLIRIGRALKDITVQEDICIARWGGEEFLIISTNAHEDVEEMAARFVRAIPNLQIQNEKSTIHEYVTISVGAYRNTIHTMEELKHFYEQTDEILYEAKRNGRNRYELKINE